jgi:hypothetical protein
MVFMIIFETLSWMVAGCTLALVAVVVIEGGL